MISAATFEELAGYAARGRIGSTIALRCSDLYPEAESEVTLAWEAGANGLLEISGVGRFAVPSAGQRRLGAGTEPIAIRLTADGDTAEILVQPRIFVPTARLRAPEYITLGSGCRLSWHSDAETCSVRLIDGEYVEEESFGPAGGFDYVARNLGELRVELEARGRHAHLNPLIGVATVATTIRVEAPPVTISLDGSEKSALIGYEATFSWRVSGAREVRIEAPDRDEIIPAPAVGYLLAVAGSRPERFRLVATGLDGAEKSAELRLVPRMLDVSHMPCELNYLNLPWE